MSELERPFDTLCTPRALEAGTFEWLVPDGWQQGRGAFGGLVVGALIRAIEAHAAAQDRPLRSLTAELCGPTLVGPAELRVETLRAGSNVTTVAARLVQGGQVQAHAVGVLGKVRTADRSVVSVSPPTAPPWSTIEPLALGPPLGPNHARFFDFFNAGPLPFSQASEPVTQGWVRLKHPGPTRDAAFLAACIDAWWPALYSVEDTIRPIATIAYTLELVGELDGLDPTAPLLYAAKDLSIRNGYFVEFRELWGEDSRLLALNQQTFALLK